MSSINPVSRFIILFSLFIQILAFSYCTPKSDSKIESTLDDSSTLHMFIGTYTRDEGWLNGTGEGIYRVKVETEGLLTLEETVAEVINPSFIALSPDQKNLYSVSELAREDEPTGYIYAFSVNEDLSLTFIDKYPTNAKAPTHVSTDLTGTLVFVANYLGGVVMVYARNEDGSLEFKQQLSHSGSGPHQNQNGSHIHMVKVSPDNNYIFVADLGSDKIWSYQINHESGTISKTQQEFGSVKPGSGPRHLDFHPILPVVYAINELNSTVSVFDYDPDTGALTETQVISTLLEDYTAWNSTADIHVHPNGKFLYASNRGHNSIASYKINDQTGELNLIAHTPTEGEFPRNFTLSPTNDMLYVANQNSNTITSFYLDSETGVLTFAGKRLSIGTPVCILFLNKN